MERTEQELQDLCQRLMMTGSKECPDCKKQTLSVAIDANYLKVRCAGCGFSYEDYFGG